MLFPVAELCEVNTGPWPALPRSVTKNYMYAAMPQTNDHKLNPVDVRCHYLFLIQFLNLL
jgi:hypothetical protein